MLQPESTSGREGAVAVVRRSTKSKGGVYFSEVVSNNKGQQQPLDKNKKGSGGKVTDQ